MLVKQTTRVTKVTMPAMTRVERRMLMVRVTHSAVRRARAKVVAVAVVVVVAAVAASAAVIVKVAVPRRAASSPANGVMIDASPRGKRLVRNLARSRVLKFVNPSRHSPRRERPSLRRARCTARCVANSHLVNSRTAPRMTDRGSSRHHPRVDRLDRYADA